MNRALTYNRIIATTLLALYLSLPADMFAHAATIEAAKPDAAQCSRTANPPCDGCPCPDDQDTSCYLAFCPCSCHVPPIQHIRVGYAPLIVFRRLPEPSRWLPQVYRTIIVPPQNSADHIRPSKISWLPYSHNNV